MCKYLSYIFILKLIEMFA